MLGVAELVSLDLILLMLAVGALVGAWSPRCSALPAGPAGPASPPARRVGDARRWSARAWSSGCTPGPTCVLGHGKLVGQQGVVTERGHRATSPAGSSSAGEIWTAAPYDERLTIDAGRDRRGASQIRGATAYVHPVAELDVLTDPHHRQTRSTA